MNIFYGSILSSITINSSSIICQVRFTFFECSWQRLHRVIAKWYTVFMKFLKSKKRSKNATAFSKKEWEIADLEHFGKASGWSEKGYYIQATEGDKILGLIHYTIISGVIEISTLIVSHNHRGKGIGTKLINKIEDIAKKDNVHKIYLVTGDGWKAENFYQKMGFEKTGEHKNHYLHKDWIIYSKFLS